MAFTRAKKKLILTHTRRRMLFGKTTANHASRFLDESGVEPDSGASYRFPGKNGSSYSSGYTKDPYRPQRSPSFGRKAESSVYSRSGSAPQAPLPDLSVGTRVHHSAFGDGTVVKITPMGGDQLLEMNFDNVGAKKLMLKAAARFLQLI